MAKNVAIYTVGADSLEGKYNGDIDSLKHASGNTAVGKSLSNARDTLLGGEASCAYLVVVLRDRLNQVLWRMMDEPRRFMRNENRSIHWGPLALCRYAVLMSVEVRKYTECWQNGRSCAECDMQTCTSASKDVEKCRFWRVMYMFGWDVRPRGDSITKKLPLLGAFSSKMAEEEGFEPS